MAIIERARVAILCLFCVIYVSAQYTIPSVTIQALKPKGIRIFIPDSNDQPKSKISLFVFQGNVNRKIVDNAVGTISAEVLNPTDGRWTSTDPDVALKIGDVINYYVVIVYDKTTYTSKILSYKIEELIDPSSATSSCRATSTVVRGARACGGQVVFEDNFDSLKEDVWQLEQYLPDEPDYPFVSYQRPPNAGTVRVEGGYLYIQPMLFDSTSNSSVLMGTLDLMSGCTAVSSKCRVQASGASILPPIVSGRLTSKMFSFTYGIVEVRAKLPFGDWLYPDILLESLFKKYGVTNYASGVLRIAGARGNSQLETSTNEEVGNKVLYGGPIMNMQCREELIGKLTNKANQAWSQNFHMYTARWSPENIILSVDGEEWLRIEPPASGLMGRLSQHCDPPRSLLNTGSMMAPFDDHFYLTLGVSAGGITEFRDDLRSLGVPKPWRNGGRKARLRFWQDFKNWYPTWSQPSLIVDYVRVTAL